MTTEQQLELEEIKKLIGDRFNKQDEKILVETTKILVCVKYS